MTIVLYDLAGIDDRRFSPNCWRSRLAIAHKDLECDARATKFTEIPMICDGRYQTIPVIEDGEHSVCDSWPIARYLETAYPDRPSLFGGDSARELTFFIQNWVETVLHAGVAPLVLLDIHDHLYPEDQDHFRRSREQRFGQTLEAVQAGREQRLEGFQKTLHPLRMMLKTRPYIGGEQPMYADYLAFGPFQWARTISPFKLLRDGDPVDDWVQRCLDLFDGLGRQTPAYY